MLNNEEILRRLATAMESLVTQLHTDSILREEEKQYLALDKLQNRLAELERTSASPSVKLEKGKLTVAGLPFSTLFKIFKWIWPVFIGTGSHFIMRWLHSIH